MANIAQAYFRDWRWGEKYLSKLRDVIYGSYKYFMVSSICQGEEEFYFLWKHIIWWKKLDYLSKV